MSVARGPSAAISATNRVVASAINPAVASATSRVADWHKPRGGKKPEREQRPIEPPGQRKANVWMAPGARPIGKGRAEADAAKAAEAKARKASFKPAYGKPAYGKPAGAKPFGKPRGERPDGGGGERPRGGPKGPRTR